MGGLVTARLRRACNLTVVAISAAGLAVSSCSKQREVDPPLPLSQWLDVCSPMETADERKSLVFLANHTVVAEESHSGSVLDDRHPLMTHGIWSGDDAGRAVSVELGGRRRSYTLYLPSSEQQCILAEGPENSADLSQAWFGVPNFSEPNDDR
jgi:hypothetical protein